jgi:ABC-type molybdate transport system substrate-binding protein
MNYVMEKGLVDVTLKRNFLVRPPEKPAEDDLTPAPQYIPAAVLANSTNRLQAMAFLEFLVSESARAVFVRQGHTPP